MLARRGARGRAGELGVGGPCLVPPFVTRVPSSPDLAWRVFAPPHERDSQEGCWLVAEAVFGVGVAVKGQMDPSRAQNGDG